MTGVSWYEADAYLRFAGKQMPTLPHWQRVAGLPFTAQILQRANLQGRGAARVGSVHALSRFGTQDLAGNVKEWIRNSAGGDLYFILGGGWDEPPYMFTDSDARPAFERAANFGIRGARFDDGDRSPEELGGVIARPDRDYTRETPAADPVFDAYRGFFRYDRTPIKAVTKATQDDASRLARRDGHLSRRVWRRDGDRARVPAQAGGAAVPDGAVSHRLRAVSGAVEPGASQLAGFRACHA